MTKQQRKLIKSYLKAAKSGNGMARTLMEIHNLPETKKAA